MKKISKFNLSFMKRFNLFMLLRIAGLTIQEIQSLFYSNSLRVIKNATD